MFIVYEAEEFVHSPRITAKRSTVDRGLLTKKLPSQDFLAQNASTSRLDPFWTDW